MSARVSPSKGCKWRQTSQAACKLRYYSCPIMCAYAYLYMPNSSHSIRSSCRPNKIRAVSNAWRAGPPPGSFPIVDHHVLPRTVGCCTWRRAASGCGGGRGAARRVARRSVRPRCLSVCVHRLRHLHASLPASPALHRCSTRRLASELHKHDARRIRMSQIASVKQKSILHGSRRTGEGGGSSRALCRLCTESRLKCPPCDAMPRAAMPCHAMP